MPAPTRTPRDRWIEHGLRALADGGPEAVRVETLAKELGVTKGGFYWHFSDRQALLEEMLDTWERLLIDQVIERIELAGGDARAKLRRLFGLASSADDLVEVELAVRAWARREPSVAERLARVDNRRMDYLRPLFGALSSSEEQAEARCLLALTLFIGNRFVVADHGNRTRADVLAVAVRLLES